MINKKIILILILLVCSIIAFFSMRSVITPYVSFKEAKRSGSFVQIIGKLNKQKSVKHDEGSFSFWMDDTDGNKLNVIHRGVKPVNFEHSDQVVVQGIYKADKDIFEAEKVLVKCPSKYKKSN